MSCGEKFDPAFCFVGKNLIQLFVLRSLSSSISYKKAFLRVLWEIIFLNLVLWKALVPVFLFIERSFYSTQSYWEKNLASFLLHNAFILCLFVWLFILYFVSTFYFHFVYLFILCLFVWLFYFIPCVCFSTYFHFIYLFIWVTIYLFIYDFSSILFLFFQFPEPDPMTYTPWNVVP